MKLLKTKRKFHMSGVLCFWCDKPITEYPVIAFPADKSECCSHCTNEVDYFHPQCHKDMETYE